MRIAQIEDLLDEFDFCKVKKVMDFLEWKYYNSADSKVSIVELQRTARRLLEFAYNVKDSTEYNITSGGFEVTRYMYPGDTIKYLFLKFVIVKGSNPCY